MNRTEYNKLQQEAKHQLSDAVKKFAERNPERFRELQEKARSEFDKPVIRPITRYIRPLSDTWLEDFRQGRKDYFVYTIDRYNDPHLYFETLTSPDEAAQVLTYRHPKFLERDETVTSVKLCTCPLCV